MKKYLYAFLAVLILVSLFAGISRLKSKPRPNLTASSPTTSPKPKAADPNTVVAKQNIDVLLKPDEKEKRVGYWVPGQQFILTKDKENGFVRVQDLEHKDWILWIREDSPYKPLVEK